MATNDELEKRVEVLEKEVQHLKAILQYQMRNKKRWFILNYIEITFLLDKHFPFGGLGPLMLKLFIKNLSNLGAF